MQCFYILTADKEGQSSSKSAPISTEAFCLTLPGRILNVTALNYAKKFRNRGNKDVALQALKRLEEDGLGRLEEVGSSHSGNIVSSLCSFHASRRAETIS